MSRSGPLGGEDEKPVRPTPIDQPGVVDAEEKAGSKPGQAVTAEEAKLLSTVVGLFRKVPLSWWMPLLVIGGPTLGVYLAQYLNLATQDEIMELREEITKTNGEIAELRTELEEDRAAREEILELVKKLAAASKDEPQ